MGLEGMNRYDVGMTSMWVQEAFSLALLGEMIGRSHSLQFERER
jgi:hypothetical protein